MPKTHILGWQNLLPFITQPQGHGYHGAGIICGHPGGWLPLGSSLSFILYVLPPTSQILAEIESLKRTQGCTNTIMNRKLVPLIKTHDTCVKGQVLDQLTWETSPRQRCAHRRLTVHSRLDQGPWRMLAHWDQGVVGQQQGPQQIPGGSPTAGVAPQSIYTRETGKCRVRVFNP